MCCRQWYIRYPRKRGITLKANHVARNGGINFCEKKKNNVVMNHWVEKNLKRR